MPLSVPARPPLLLLVTFTITPPPPSHFIFWNARSLYRKLPIFKTTLSSYSPLVVGVCETWLTDAFSPSFPNYTSYRLDRGTGEAGGGLLLLTHQSLPSSPITFTPFPGGKLEYLGVTVTFNSGPLSILLIYNPCLDVTLQEYKHLFSQLPSPTLIMGDFNAHHDFWEPALPRSRRNRSGVSLAAFLADSTSLSLLTPPGLPTRTDPVSGNSSTLDLCLGNGPLLLTTITTGPYMGSDHLPVIISFPTVPPPPPPSRRPRWSLKTGDMISFRTELNSQNPPDSLPPEDKIKYLTDILVTVGSHHFHLTSSHPSRSFRVPWWSRKCEAALQAKRHAFKAWRKSPNPPLRRRFHLLEARCKRVILDEKRSAWASFCASLSFSTAVSRVWSFLRKMVNPQPPLTFPLTNNGVPLVTAAQKVECLASHIHTTLGLPDPVPPPVPPPSPHTGHMISPAITPQELSSTLHSLPTGRAAGPDNIPNEFLRCLSGPLATLLLDVFNTSWVSGTFPSEWRHAVTIPILKPGKDPKEASSYRPISLICNPSKILEHIIKNRLAWFIEHKHILPPNMFGFRPHRSTLDALLLLENLIQEGYNHKQFTLVAFLDLKGAFDTASHNAIIVKLARLGLFGPPLQWFQSFLSDRSFSLVIGNTFSRSYPITRGVPQGSPLSPLLFNILLSDFPSTPGTQAILYADDISLLCSAPTIQEAQTCLQRGLDAIHSWTSRWGLTVCAQKSSLLCFTTRRIPNIPTATIDGSPIPFKTQHKFLGLLLDGPRLTWDHHIQYLVTSSLKRLNIMKSLAGVKWGADRRTLLHFYCTYIRSRLDYGCEVYGAASPSILQKLDTIQNTAMRIALGAFRSSPITALQAETSLTSLSHRRSTLLVRAYTKLASSPSCHALHSLLLRQGREPLRDPIPYQAHTPFVDRALSFFATIRVTPPPFGTLEKTSPLGPWFPLSSMLSLSLQTTTPWSKASCPVLGKNLFNALLHTQYSSHFHIYTDGSRLPNLPSVGAATYVPSRNLATAWRLPAETSILTAELFAIREGLKYAVSLASPCPIALFTDSLTALQLIHSHRPRSHHDLTFTIHLLLCHLTSAGFTPHLQWVPSHVGIAGNTVADRAAAEAHSHLNTVDLPTDQTDFLTNLRSTCRGHWDTTLTDRLRHTRLGELRNNPQQHHWTHSPCRALDTAITRLRIGHTRLNAHRHRLGLTDTPHCPWCPTQLETPEHLLLHCPRHHSHRVALLHSLSLLHIRRPTLAVLLGGIPNPGLASRAIKLTGTFLQKSNQLQRI